MRKILVIGAGAAGLAAATRARRVNAEASVIVLEATGECSRGTCSLPYYVSGEVPDRSRLIGMSAEELGAKGIDVKLRCPAERIDLAQRRVETPKGHFSYDRLIVAVGARPRPIPTSLEQPAEAPLLQLQSIADAERTRRVLAALPKGSRVAVVGGGYLGLEWIELLTKRQFQPVLYHAGSTLSHLDPEVSVSVEEVLVRRGVELNLARRVRRLRSVGRAMSVVHSCVGDQETSDPVDAVALATGVRPNCDLLLEAGLKRLGGHGGIPVSSRGETELSGVLAAGDSVELPAPHGGPRRRWAPLATVAARMGRVCGENAAGGSARLGPLAAPLCVRLFEAELGMVGFPQEWADSEKLSFRWGDRSHPFPSRRGGVGVLYFEPSGGNLKGGQIFGAGARAFTDLLAFAVARDLTLDDLLDLEIAYNPPLSPMWHPLYHAARSFRKTAKGQTYRLGYQPI